MLNFIPVSVIQFAFGLSLMIWIMLSKVDAQYIWSYKCERLVNACLTAAFSVTMLTGLILFIL